jgi:hypothetical protein
LLMQSGRATMPLLASSSSCTHTNKSPIHCTGGHLISTSHYYKHLPDFVHPVVPRETLSHPHNLGNSWPSRTTNPPHKPADTTCCHMLADR